MKVEYSFPSHQQALCNTELARTFEHLLCTTTLNGRDAVVRVLGGDAFRPDAFYVYLVPSETDGDFRAGFHYLSPSLPALTTTMFEHYSEFQTAIDPLLQAFVCDITAARFVERSSIGDGEFQQILVKFDRALPF